MPASTILPCLDLNTRGKLSRGMSSDRIGAKDSRSPVASFGFRTQSERQCWCVTGDARSPDGRQIDCNCQLAVVKIIVQG